MRKKLLRKTISIFSCLSLILSCVIIDCNGQDNKSSNSKINKTPMLYGRIEQLAGGSGAQFPVLKEQTAQLDKRQVPRTVQRGQATAFTGSIVRSFPEQYSGTWGGHLKIWASQMDPICWQLDADEANRTKQFLVPGREGSVNLQFNQIAAGKIDLSPAQVIFMVPMKDTNMQQELNSMLGAGGLGQAGGLTLPGMDSTQMANAMQKMANNMTVPIMISFGAMDDPNIKGVSGNQIKAVLLSNTIRQLNASVIEQQIVAEEIQRNNKTGQVRHEYAESVFRFTRQTADTLYVQAAAVNYTSDRKFERKLILYGTVRKGQVMRDTVNPMNPLGNMMPGNGQLPILPGGQNPFQNLLPQQ